MPFNAFRKRITLDENELRALYGSTEQLATLAESTERFADALSAQMRSEKAALTIALRRMRRIASDHDIDLREERRHCYIFRKCIYSNHNSVCTAIVIAICAVRCVLS